MTIGPPRTKPCSTQHGNLIEDAINEALKETIQYRVDEAASLEDDFKLRILNIRKYLEEVNVLDEERLSYVRERLH